MYMQASSRSKKIICVEVVFVNLKSHVCLLHTLAVSKICYLVSGDANSNNRRLVLQGGVPCF